MKTLSKIIILGLFVSNTLLAAQYAVVSNQNMKSVSKIQIKAMFLKKISLIDDTKIIPVNLQARDELREKFESHILKMSFNRLKSFWTKQHYLGHRPPLSMQSQESIKAFVKKVDGAIGYIHANALDDELKVLYKWED